MATEAALKSLEYAYEKRNGGLFEPAMTTALETIDRAKQSGDATRKSEIQINLDLDGCAEVMRVWRLLLADQGLDAVYKARANEHKEERERNEKNFREAIDRLQEDRD